MKRLLAFLLISVLLPCGCSPKKTPALTVRVFSIGQADSILLTDGETSVLVDTGEKDDGGKIADAIEALGIDRLDLLILTHFDKDHIGGAPELLGRIAADRVLMPAYVPDAKRYQKLLDALSAGGIEPERLTADTSLTIGTLTFDVWVPASAYVDGTDTDNDQSLVTRVTFEGTRLLLTGDAEDIRTQELLSGGYDLACDVLKIPHHGRYHETSAALLDAATPKYALITDSTKNPAENALIKLLNERGVETLRTISSELYLTIKSGNIEIAVDP